MYQSMNEIKDMIEPLIEQSHQSFTRESKLIRVVAYLVNKVEELENKQNKLINLQILPNTRTYLNK